MSRQLPALAVLCAIGACAGPMSLFNGSSLDGWRSTGEADWSVESREIVATGDGQGFLITEALYGDFHLRLEFWVESTVNSGVFIRCQDRSYIHPDTCYEFNIWDEHPQQEARTGSIVFQVMPPLAQVETLGRWNTYEITARGSFLEARVNGEITARLKDAKIAPGFIALQHWETGTIRFRNIELKLL